MKYIIKLSVSWLAGWLRAATLGGGASWVTRIQTQSSVAIGVSKYFHKYIAKRRCLVYKKCTCNNCETLKKNPIETKLIYSLYVSVIIRVEKELGRINILTL